MTGKEKKINLISTLLRELEAEMGTRDVADLVMRALLMSVRTFKGKSLEDFCEQFAEVNDVISQTEPKFGILNYYFARLRLEIKEATISCKKADKKWRYIATKRIKRILKESQQHKGEILAAAEGLNVNGKTILIHDHSHTVHDVLANFKKMGHQFEVVIAEQDYEKSHGNIERMHNLKIPFKVVPSYMLSHMHQQIDMLFFGALTLKNTMHFVMDPGTHSIISEFHLEGVPTYMFFDTTKCSLWKSKKRGEIFMRTHARKHKNKPIAYDKVKYSHDRVPVSLFKKVITNEGVFTPKTIEKLYKAKLKKYAGLCG